MKKNNKGVTLIALVVTIIVLMILAGISISILTGENGLINKTKFGKDESSKQTAVEAMNLKITECQMQSYVEKGKLPNLAYLVAFLQKDKETTGDIEYVEMQSKKQANIDETPYTDWNKVYTKLKAYPYEFEINSELQLASVDGIKVAKDPNSKKTFTVFLDGNEINYFPEITNTVKLITATASNGAKIEFNESDLSFKISNLSDLNTTFQLNYRTINNYTELENLAGISSSDYDSIGELVDDSSALEKILDSEEATQYLTKSDEFINAITNSQTAIQNIANSEKLMYKIMLNDTLKQAVLNSSYSELIDNAALKVPVLNSDDGNIIYSSCMSGYTVYNCFNDGNNSWRPVHWEEFQNTYLGYNFNENVVCYKVGIMLINGGYGNKTRQATFETSVDGTNWSPIIDTFSITTSSNEMYYYNPTNLRSGRYFRFKGVSGDTLQAYGQYGHDVARLQFYCVKVVNN